METLGDRAKKQREKLNISQEELAQKMGYKSKTSIHKIETGLTDLPNSKIEILAKSLKTTPAYLMGWEDKEKNKNNQNNIDLSILSEAQLQRLDMILATNNVMFFNGNKDIDEETAEELRQSITEVYIHHLKETGQL